MHPILFSLGPITLRSYGVMVALGAALAVWLAWRQTKREGMDSELFLDLALWLVIAGLAGGRLLYVLISWRDYMHAPWDIVKIWEGGLVFYGGFLAAVAAALVFCRRHQLPVWKVLDLIAPYAALAHAAGRIGCFLNGCCYGLPSTKWGVVFPALMDSVPHLPAQLFESAANLCLFGWLLFLHRHRRFAGQVFWSYVLLYAVVRFGLEFLRGDEIRGTIGLTWLHTSQLIALLAIGFSGGMLFFLSRKTTPTFPSSSH